MRLFRRKPDMWRKVMRRKLGLNIVLVVVPFIMVSSVRGEEPTCCFDWGMHGVSGVNDAPPFPAKKDPIWNFARCTPTPGPKGGCFEREWRQAFVDGFVCVDPGLGLNFACVSKTDPLKIIGLHAQKGSLDEIPQLVNAGACSVSGNPCIVDDQCPGETCEGVEKAEPGTIDYNAESQVPSEPVPALPAWGLVGLGVLLLAGGAIVFGRRRTRVGLETE